jgi:integrase/recombinase XerD
VAAARLAQRPDATETKNHCPFELPLPDIFNAWIEAYLARYRPHLLRHIAADHPSRGFFWISERGTPLCVNAVIYRVNAVTRRELGQAVNPHLFRKIVSTELAIADPAHVGVAQRILGHSSYDTTQKAYNLSRAIDAARQVQNMLNALRSAGCTPQRWQRPAQGFRDVAMHVNAT